jgi:hypothetical protein
MEDVERISTLPISCAECLENLNRLFYCSGCPVKVLETEEHSGD